jgi:hypothetical protein
MSKAYFPATPPPEVGYTPVPKLSTDEKSYPGITQMTQSALGSMVGWIKSGARKVSQEVIDSRLSICSSCEWWEAKALKNTGRCIKCGCSTWAKLRMATERCPTGKWGPVD